MMTDIVLAKAGFWEDAFKVANFVEMLLWIAMGVIVLLMGLRKAGVVRRYCLTAGLLLIAFGASDGAETQTGAWWRPVWLLVWKGVCVVGLAGVLMAHYRHRSRATNGKPE